MSGPHSLVVADVEDFTRRLRAGEPVDLNRIREVEAHCNDTVARLRRASHIRRSAINALAAIGQHKRALELAARRSPSPPTTTPNTGRGMPPHSATTTDAESKEGTQRC